MISRIIAIRGPRKRLVALGRGAYAGAPQGNAHTALLAVADDPHVGPVIERVTRTRLALLEGLYGDLGLTPGDAARHARVAYALYLGIGELRRADPEGDHAGQDLDGYLELAVEMMLAHATNRRDELVK